MEIRKISDLQMKIRNSYVLKAFLLNIGVLTILLILFKPVIKSDDYYLSEIIYGAVSGESDVHLVYNNILLGYLIKGLLSIAPDIAWYTFLQIFFVFIAFFVLTWFVYKSNHNKHILAPVIFLLFWFGYECYIRITFTKTAIILAAIGLFLIFKAIASNKKEPCLYVIGLLGIFVAILYRGIGINTALGIMIGICFIELLHCYLKSGIKFMLRKAVLYVLSILMIVGINNSLAKINKYLYSTDSRWNSYYYANNLKSSVVDYTSNNYASNKEKYSEIGVSENDLAMIYNNDLYDPEYINEDKIKEILSIAREQKQKGGLLELFKSENIQDFLRSVPIEYLRLPVFSCYIILSVFFFVYGPKKKYLYWVYSFIMILVENYYLFLLGRYLQSYIDTGIIFSACLFLLYFMYNDNMKTRAANNKMVQVPLIFTIIALTMTNSISELTAPYFHDYGSKNASNPAKSRKIMNIITKDDEHLYIMPSKESVFSKWCFEGTEIIPKGYFHNTFTMGSYIWASQKEAIDNFKVKNPLKELADSENLYFLVSDDIESNSVDTFLTYIQEHYDKDAKMEKIKEISSANIYKCFSGNLDVENYPVGEGKVNSEISMTVDDQEIAIEGYCFKRDSNSYNQNVYIEIVDKDRNDTYYYTTLKTKNGDFENLMEGQYSYIKKTLETAEYWDQDDYVGLVLIADGHRYKIPISGEE